MAVLQIVYTSRLTILAAERRFELERISRQSKERNQAAGITGSLLIANDEVVQLLEGAEKPLLDLFQKIRHDHRHTDVTRVYQNLAAKPCLSEWSMVVRDISTHTGSLLRFHALLDAYRRSFQFRLDDYLHIVHSHLQDVEMLGHSPA